MKLFRHLVRSINDHEHYHTENNSLDFTAVPKQCLCTLNLLKTSLPILYTSWLDKYNPANPTQNVRYCCDLLTVITEPTHKCPYTATYAIGPFSRSDWLVDVMTGMPKQVWTWGSMPFPPANFLAGYQEFTHFSKDPVDSALFDPKKIPGAPQCQPGNGEMLKRSMQNFANIYAQYQQGSEL